MSDVELYISKEVLSEYGAAVLARVENFIIDHQINLEDKNNLVIALYEELIREKNKIYRKESKNLDAVKEIRAKFDLGNHLIEKISSLEKAD